MPELVIAGAKGVKYSSALLQEVSDFGYNEIYLFRLKQYPRLFENLVRARSSARPNQHDARELVLPEIR